ncbi:MAG TPA: hypothetical protein VIT89_03780 [Solirubrobacterales bacterium]
MPAGRRKLTWAQIAIMRRGARKRERFIAAYSFPDYIWKRVRKQVPSADEAEMLLIEQGLREWFICCAWRGRAVLGMPSQAVDHAWHEFILDSLAYTRFCEQAFGGYLHHTPDEAMTTPMGDALGETVRAWDRSEAARGKESVLWDLDERLGLEQPMGLNGLQVAGVRSRAGYTAGAATACFVGAGGEGGGGESGGGCGGGGGGGDSGGGGGGCGGGGS